MAQACKNKYHSIGLFAIGVLIFLIGCGSNESTLSITDDSGDDDNTEETNITNAILSNRSANCADYVLKAYSNVRDVQENISYTGNVQISRIGNKCQIQSDAIPNHDFNDAAPGFVNRVSEQNQVFEITTSPQFAQSNTALSLNYDDGVLLNGVKIDLLAAGCYGVGDGKIGCHGENQLWRYDPMHSDNDFGTDAHNAHTQPDGTYHYHGSPLALFDTNAQIVSPLIGFAADGFPIYGPYFNDGTSVRAARSSYRLRSGVRPTGSGNPGGDYDGTYRDDYEYIEGLGDLDECNGVTIDGVYAYYVTNSYPWILGCYKGTPDTSFRK